MVWLPGPDKFTIYPQPGKTIQDAFMAKLTQHDWQLEVKMDIATVKQPSKVDAVYSIVNGTLFAEDRYFAIEW